MVAVKDTKSCRYDIEDWRKHKLAIFAYGEPEPHIVDHIKHCLEDGKKVRKLLLARKDIVRSFLDPY